MSIATACVIVWLVWIAAVAIALACGLEFD